MPRGNAPHLGNPEPELLEEQLVRHGDDQVATLHRFRSLVGCFQLRIHPFVGEKTGAILGNTVAAHQAQRFAHRIGARAGVPQLGRRTQHPRHRIGQDKPDQDVLIRFVLPCSD
jgi:hypothetical protein